MISYPYTYPFDFKLGNSLILIQIWKKMMSIYILSGLILILSSLAYSYVILSPIEPSVDLTFFNITTKTFVSPKHITKSGEAKLE